MGLSIVQKKQTGIEGINTQAGAGGIKKRDRKNT
jgi:hypothetical protein